MGEWTLPKLKKRFDAKDMTLNEAACIAGELLHENAVLGGELSTAQTECDELKKRCEKLEAQLTTEEECAMNSGGILSDVCDLVFDDPERAATHGYKGVHNKIAEIKNQLRLYQLGVGKHCADFCLETKDGTGPCFTCPLGKL